MNWRPGNGNFPPNNYLGEPLPVSRPPFDPPPGVGNTGYIYGTQQAAVWQPGEVDARQVCDVMKAGALWRFSAFGRVVLTVNFGTQGNRALIALAAPLVLSVPGQLTVTATPVDDAGASCVVTLTQATAGARSIARRFIDAGAGPALALDDDAVDFFALTASTLTISGAAVVVPALAIVPLVSGSVLNTGSGFQEFET